MLFGKMLEECQNYGCFDIFWDTLYKMKDNLDRECVKVGFYPSNPSKEKLAHFSLFLFSLENYSFPVLTLLFCLSLLTISFSHRRKNLIL